MGEVLTLKDVPLSVGAIAAVGGHMVSGFLCEKLGRF